MKKTTKLTIVILVICSIFYGGNVVYSTLHKQDEILILGYHNIVPDEDKEVNFKNSMWTASTSSFDAQMKLLYDLGYHSVSLDDVYAWRMGKKKLDAKSVVITFDDGFLSSKKFAQPIMEKYGFQGSVFVIGSMIPKRTMAYDPAKRVHASLQDMKDDHTLKYFSHTYDLHHKKNGAFKVDTLRKAQLREDNEKQKRLVSTRYVAYPYGASNETIKTVLKEEGTLLAFGYNENRKANIHDDLYALPRFNVNAYTRLDVFRTMLES